MTSLGITYSHNSTDPNILAVYANSDWEGDQERAKIYFRLGSSSQQ